MTSDADGLSRCIDPYSILLYTPEVAKHFRRFCVSSVLEFGGFLFSNVQKALWDSVSSAVTSGVEVNFFAFPFPFFRHCVFFNKFVK